MFKDFQQGIRNQNAQVTVSEYVLVLFIVMAVMASMGIYFRRAVQARIRDARVAMLNMVYTRAEGFYSGNLYVEYEPYYTKTDGTISADATQTTRLIPTQYGEQYFKDFQEYTNSWTMSETAPPKEAD